MNRIKITLISMFLLAMQLPTIAQQCCDSTPCDCGMVAPSLAPFSVMGDHLHHKGGWMVSYQYRKTTAEGMLAGTSDLNRSAVYDHYMMSPEKMTMHGHMVGVMYGVSNNVTVMAMLPYMTMDMPMQPMMGAKTPMHASGLGDLKLEAFFRMLSSNNFQLMGGVGVSVPTGSIEETGDMPMVENAPLPYGMQLGSGSWGLRPSVTLVHARRKISSGMQVKYVCYANDNKNDYRLGNQLDAALWMSYRPVEWMSVAAKGKWAYVGEIDGTMEGLNPMMSPLANALNYGKTTATAGLGLNVYMPWEVLHNHVLGLEWEKPIYQDVNGIQQHQNSAFLVGWKYSF